MKKKLLTIFAVLALVVAMVFSIVACGPSKSGGGKTDDPKTDDPTTDDPKKDPPKTNLDKLAKEGLGVFYTGLENVMTTAMDKSDQKSYDLTVFVKVKVGDSVDADVKLRVAGTFGGNKNSGLVDVIVGGKSYVTLYAANNMVYVGEALTQDEMRWFAIDTVKDDGIMDKFFPELVKLFPLETVTKQVMNKTTWEMEDEKETMHEFILSFVSIVKSVGASIMATDVEGGIVKNELSDGGVQYVNTLALGNVGSLLQDLKFIIDVRDLLSNPAIDPYRGLIDTVCSIVFGGSLDDLLDGKIKPEDAPEIVLSYAADKDENLTDLELSYKNDFAFDKTEDAKKTEVSVAFGLENVKVTHSSSTKIIDTETENAAKAAVQPAIKLSIAADIPGKDVGATVDAYVIPKVTLAAHEYYSVPVKEFYRTQYYTDKKVTTPKPLDGNHTCGDECVHFIGEDRYEVEADHKHNVNNVKGLTCIHEFDYDGGEVKAGHECLKDCKHYYKIDTVNTDGVKAYAIAKNNKTGDAVNLACDADASKLPDGEIVLRFDLAGVYEILGLEAPADTKFQKTFKLWSDEEKEPEGGKEDENKPAEDPEKDPADEGEKKEPTNLIDKVVAIFSEGFSIGKVMDLVNPVIDFAKGIYNDVLKDAITTPDADDDDKTNTATLDVSAILSGLLENTIIKGSESLKINGEDNLTAYLSDLKGVAALVDNIMRATSKENPKPEKGTKFNEADLIKIVKEYAGFEITDEVFDDGKTVLEVTGIRDKDLGLGFTAELKALDQTVIKLTMKVDIVDATKVPASTIDNTFVGGELDGGEASDSIIELLKDIHEAFKAKEKAAEAA